ncbi:MAG: outer membrane beta-barrel domain-containing protein [Gammaproteobacteria bacterium]
MVLAATMSACSVFGRDKPPMEDANASAPVISPEVERREIKRPKIDTENFEVGAFAGLLSVEDFGSTTVYGLRGRYHITEGLFAEGTYATSSALGLTSAEVLAGFDLLGSDRKYEYYDVSVGYNLLPGETFIGRNWAFNSALYVIAGAGQTSLGVDDYFTMTFGAGYQVLATDWLALDFGVRDHLFDLEFTSGEKKSTHNIELTMGINFFF